MHELTQVELSLRVPESLAIELQDLQRNRPDLIARILQYGVTRQLVLEHLSEEVGRRGAPVAVGG